MTALYRGRWATSFADLCMLLLGFFVLLSVSRHGSAKAISDLSDHFAGRPAQGIMLDIRAAELFAPGEAMLIPPGRARLQHIGNQAIEKNGIIVISSIGEDRAGGRFDRWEQAAARLAAVARALRESGLPEDRVLLRGPDAAKGSRTGAGAGQRLLIWQRGAGESGD